jgi:hypothetical protein
MSDWIPPPGWQIAVPPGPGVWISDEEGVYYCVPTESAEHEAKMLRCAQCSAPCLVFPEFWATWDGFCQGCRKEQENA